jgi:protein-tyrosine phosphatase
MNRNLLKRNEIHAVVNCTTELPNEFEDDKDMQISYIRIPLNDTPFDQNTFISRIKCILEFIRYNVIMKRNVLVHCHAGVSRSASVVAAYIIKYCNLDVDRAVKAVVSRRPVAFHHGDYVTYMPALRQFQKSITQVSAFQFRI